MWKSIKWCKSSEVECCHLFIYLFRRGTLLEVISEYKQSVNCNMSFGIVNIKLKFNPSKGWQLNLTDTAILPLTSRPTSYTSILILIQLLCKVIFHSYIPYCQAKLFASRK